MARALLAEFDVRIASHVLSVGPVPPDLPMPVAWDDVAALGDDRPLRCVDEAAEARMVEAIDEARRAGDTLGGIFEVIVRGLPPGLGSHTSWDGKLDGRLARAFMSIHAVKAVEIGEGVAAARSHGSAVHDEIVYDASTGGYRRSTNRAGGLEGGVTTGEELRVRGYLKPISTLRKRLMSVDVETHEPSEAAFERSDITAVPAAGVIGEAMIAVVLADAMRAKFGGDSMREMRRNYDGYMQQVRQF